MKLILNLICYGFAGYALVLAALYFFQEKFLFFPGPAPFGNCPEMEKQNARAVTSGTVRYYFKPALRPNSWIVIFHGNAGNACDRIYFLDLLKDVRSHVVIFEYPGFGKDSNAPGEALILKQALELILHIKGKNDKNIPIYLMGESLGTGVATWVAGQTDISGLILISAYTSITRVAQHHYPWAPVKYLLKHKFQADIWATQTRTPALLFHGTNDDTIPIHFARQQVLNFKGEKKLVEIPGCGHNDIIDMGKILIQKEIHEFIESDLDNSGTGFQDQSGIWPRFSSKNNFTLQF